MAFMNKLNWILPTTLLAALALTACSETPYKPNAVEGECIVGGQEAPQWVCGSYQAEGQYTAVGSAKMSALGMDFTRKEALANARANLANQIQLAVKAKLESYQRSTGATTEIAERIVTQVSRQVSDLTLKDSRQISYWENTKQNTIYLLVGTPKAQADASIERLIPQAIEAAPDTQRNNAAEQLKGI
jgi:hypothetical protein